MPCHEQPDFRPCSACEVPMNRNALYSFVGRRVRCLCEVCWALGFRFDPDGAVVLGPEPRARAVGAT
jgi:hypothetical protein